MAAKKRTKETSDRVSRIAAEVLAGLKGVPGGVAFTLRGRESLRVLWVADIRALADSCLSQDTTKGKRRSPAEARHIAKKARQRKAKRADWSAVDEFVAELGKRKAKRRRK